MKKTVLIFGVISGAVSSGIMLATLPFVDKLDFDKGAIIGYTSLVLSALVVFFGVRSYRDNVGNGHLGFGRGFATGLLITLISCACYVVTWEILYFKLMPDFGQKFATHMVDRVRDAGGTPQQIADMRRQADSFKQMYDNPLMNAAITFTEPFPIGLVVSVLSAAILRKK
jgi:hypothetical protein